MQIYDFWFCFFPQFCFPSSRTITLILLEILWCYTHHRLILFCSVEKLGTVWFEGWLLLIWSQNLELCIWPFSPGYQNKKQRSGDNKNLSDWFLTFFKVRTCLRIFTTSPHRLFLTMCILFSFYVENDPFSFSLSLCANLGVMGAPRITGFQETSKKD